MRVHDYNTLYLELLSGHGETRHDRDITRAQNDFELYCVDNPGYVADAKRNGVEQRFLVTRSEVQYKYNITAFPGEDLFPGDIIECYGEHWIVVNTRVGNAVQATGLMWQCNHEFVFQNFDSTIHRYYGVLDSGVYSTTRTSDPTIQTLNQQYKIYLPYNEHTALIYEDKRLAAGKWIDKDQNDILTTYEVTGRDYISKGYGEGAHLLILYVRSSKYNRERDNAELGICDYIAPSDSETAEIDHALLKCEITGRSTIRVGLSKTYRAVFYDIDGNAIDGVTPSWNYISDNENISFAESDGSITVNVPNHSDAGGSTVTLILSDASQAYSPAIFEIEVTT